MTSPSTTPDPTPSSDLAALAARAEDHLEALVGDLARLVGSETPSDDKALLDAGLDDLIRLLEERLGAPAEMVRHDGGDRGDVALLEHAGTAPGAVLLLCHYDTVWPAGTLAGWPFAVADGRATGPGCLDMKAGIVQGVWALRLLREAGLPHPTVRFLLTGDEEIGSTASRAHIEAASEDVLATLTLEPSADGDVKTRRKGVGTLDITAQGIESHAGLDPYVGASAVHALAAVVTEVAGLGDRAKGTTVNVGRLSGGTGRNVIAGQARAEVDIRVSDPDEPARMDAALAALQCPDPRVAVEVRCDWDRPPMTPNPASEQLVEIARSAAARLGRTLGTASVGGASDANFVSALGRPVMDGLGAVGAGPHARHEHIDVTAFPRQTALTAAVMAELVRER